MMKKFTFLIVPFLVCFVLASCQKTEPKPECILKDFPYEIHKVEKMKLYVASEKYHHPDLDCRKKNYMQVISYILLILRMKRVGGGLVGQLPIFPMKKDMNTLSKV